MLAEKDNIDFTRKAVLLEELGTLSQDFKASVIAAEIAEHGIASESFFFRNQSTFKRPVSRDIEEIFWSEADNAPSRLVFDLNREGIYDMLPEALIHNQATQKRAENATKLGNELRRQEKDARNFFSPLENEFHYRSLKLDVIERELLKNNNPRRNREFFHYFFEDSSILTDRQLLLLLYILPLSHKIRSNLDLMGLTITRILNYTVIVSARWLNRQHRLPEASVSHLGDGNLGVDTILSDNCIVPSRYYDVTVTGISTEDYPHFRNKGKHINVLNFILPYFFSAGADYGITLQCTPEAADFATADDSANNYLGFNSYI